MIPSDALTLLKRIEMGKEQLIIPKGFDSLRDWGDIEVTTINGWKIIVFNDCGEWDYWDSITNPCGDTVNNYDDNWYPLEDDLDNPLWELINYMPPDLSIWGWNTHGGS
jgi:hypothetical protein